MNKAVPRTLLLEMATFATDEPVGVAAVPQSALPGPIEESEWQYIPERLWKRLLSIGAAYELHFPQIVEPIIDSVLLPEQCESFIEEMAFLGSFVDDPALHHALEVLTFRAALVVRSSGFRLVVSPP